ncbi:MAG TPA: hypothetical protein VND93_02925 [Myxococcales bacterium]|jgi:hypothetical protein|nr:hypothetical protein [Myxococcales bacterium]
MRSLLPLAACAALAATAFGPGCKCARSGFAAPDAAGIDDDQVRPNYDLTGPTHPLAAKLCDALHKLPLERRVECCHGGGGVTMVSQCTAMLSSALRLGAVTAEAEAVDRCAKAMEAAYAGCAWVGPNDVPLPEVCQGLLKGTLAAGARCRSSLECQDGLRCAGSGPTDLGRCAPPGPTGLPCEISVDALAGYVRQDLRRGHSECQGWCQRRFCQDPVKEGGQCLADLQCQTGMHCAGGACVPGPVSGPGEKCSPGGCQRPLRCIQDTCRAPAEEGAACTQDYECQGGCVQTDAGSRCGPACNKH